jgi:hypothetical protein
MKWKSKQWAEGSLGTDGVLRVRIHVVANWKDIRNWEERLGHSRLRCFTDEHGHFWLEQNATKESKWAKLAREGHEIAWEFDSPGGSYTGTLLIDGEIYTTAEATRKFLKPQAGSAQ